MSRPALRSVMELRAVCSRTIPLRPAPQSLLGTLSSSRPYSSSTPVTEGTPSAAPMTTTTTRTTTSEFPPANKQSHRTPLPCTAARFYPPQPPLHKPLSDSVRTLLPHLAAAPRHYLTAHVNGAAYLLTLGDHVRLPFRMRGARPGDVLRLTRASAVGSRDLTLRGSPFVDERLFECRATVLGVESEPLRIKVKKKRRCRRKKRVRSKHPYTMLAISELRVKRLDEVEGA